VGRTSGWLGEEPQELHEREEKRGGAEGRKKRARWGRLNVGRPAAGDKFSNTIGDGGKDERRDWLTKGQSEGIRNGC